MMFRAVRLAYYAFLGLLVGCSSLPSFPLRGTPTPAPIQSATSTPQATLTQSAPDVAVPGVLRVWLPPRFDPSASTASADLLKQRLAQFEADHPAVKIEIRVKAEDGDNDLLNSLSVTSMAAPSALPDLIALTHSDMESAALKGLLHPIDGLTTLLQDPDWYGYARQLGRVQNTGYGLPFASDAMVIVYRPAVLQSMPPGWDAIIKSGVQMAFPVSDPQAYFPLSLYISMNDQIANEQGSITLDEATLVRVLSFYRQLKDSGRITIDIRDFQNDQQSLKYYNEGIADLAVIWASSDLASQRGQFIPVYGLNDDPYSLADGWVWALAGPGSENQIVAAELASYLVESDFMSAWTAASGYLPTRPQALDGWENAELKESINTVLQYAYPAPSEDVISVMGPLLRQALVRIFNGDQPETVARGVIESLK